MASRHGREAILRMLIMVEMEMEMEMEMENGDGWCVSSE